MTGDIVVGVLAWCGIVAYVISAYRWDHRNDDWKGR